MGCSSSSPLPAQKDSYETLGDSYKSWRVFGALGEGSFARVYDARNKTSGLCAALKIPKGLGHDPEGRMEAAVWKKVGTHNNIVNFIDEFVVDGTYSILMEKCAYSLSELLIDMPVSGESHMARMFFQMASAIAHLEALCIVHRDVKPDNFLCKGDGQTLKLCDFGFAKLMPVSGQLFGTYGTPNFMSPEMVGDGPHDLKTDVWSLGAIFYRMLYGECPYGACQKSRVMKAIATDCPKPRYQGKAEVSHFAKEVVTTLLQRTCSTRLFATQSLNLTFLHAASETSTSDGMPTRIKLCKPDATENIVDDSTHVSTNFSQGSEDIGATFSL